MQILTHDLSMNQSLLSMILIMILLFEIGTLFVFTLFLMSFKSASKRFLQLSELDIQYKYTFSTDTIDAELDKFISSIFISYIYINKFTINTYISEIEEVDMYEKVLDEVLSKMSNILMNRMLLVYNKEKIHEVIKDRVVMIVSRYCSENNAKVSSEN